MLATGALLLISALPGFYASTVPWYGQCGGSGYDGLTNCVAGSSCEQLNEYFSMCVPQPSPDERPGPYDQCGGQNYNGFLCPSNTQCCSSGLQCIWINEYFSQCRPEGNLADLDEPCGPATTDNKSCLLRSQASGPVLMKCSSDTDPDAVCVLCGYRDLACCPAGVVSPNRPPCQAAPDFTAEIACNTEEDVCEGDVLLREIEMSVAAQLQSQ